MKLLLCLCTCTVLMSYFELDHYKKVFYKIRNIYILLKCAKSRQSSSWLCSSALDIGLSPTLTVRESEMQAHMFRFNKIFSA